MLAKIRLNSNFGLLNPSLASGFALLLISGLPDTEKMRILVILSDGSKPMPNSDSLTQNYYMNEISPT